MGASDSNAVQADDLRPPTSTEKASTDIEVQLFRLILFVPFAIEARESAESLEGSGLELVEALEEQLKRPADGSHPWQSARSLLRHLSGDGDGDVDDPLSIPAYEEFVYFPPYVQRFLFDAPRSEQGIGSAQKPALRLWQRTDFQVLDVEIFNKLRRGANLRRFRLSVDRLNLYLFDTGNAILTVELSFDRTRLRTLEAGQAPDGFERKLWLDDAIALTAALRRVYPPFFQKGREADDYVSDAVPRAVNWRKLPTDHADDPAPGTIDAASYLDQVRCTLCPPLHPAWLELLRPLAVEGYNDSEPVRLSLCGDDCAPFMVMLGVDDVHAIADSDWVRICFGDKPGPPHEYPESPAHFAAFPQRHCYDRFWQRGHPWLPTRHLCSGFGYALVGQCAPVPGMEGYVAERHDPFRDTLQHHFRRHYFQLGLISHFQKTALTTLSERLASGITRLGYPAEPGDRKLQKFALTVQADALRFTHRYWFTEISPQPQAQDLFALWRRHLRTAELFDQLSREIGESSAFLDRLEQTELGRQQATLANAADTLARIGLPAIMISTLAGVFGMNFFDAAKLEALWPVWAFLGVVLTGGLYWLVHGAMREWTPGRLPADRVRTTVLLVILAALLLFGLASHTTSPTEQVVAPETKTSVRPGVGRGAEGQQRH